LCSSGPSSKFTGFYGHLDAVKRPKAWSLLRHLSRFAPRPWLVVGDFNEITRPGEKSSYSIHPHRQMAAFQNTLYDCHLGDLGFSGTKYTWDNGRSRTENTLERLDRAVANPGWCNLYDVVDVLVLPRYSSDHSPLLVSFSNSVEVRWIK
jgi:endonuclease/exonuclease/phosphatase family metal-dependent hydrolase